MATHEEKRAALAGIAPLSPKEPASMKIRFQSVLLDITIPRLSADKGLASSDTSFFDIVRTPGVTIELDTGTQLVRLSKGDVASYVHVTKVTRFGDVVA